jgi:DNA repair ATPase RecN
MEEVEKEVAEIMVKATNDLDEAYHEVVSTQNLIDTGTGDLEQYLETIELARKRMMRADQVLEDCSSILKGYKLAIKQLEEQQDAIQTG